MKIVTIPEPISVDFSTTDGEKIKQEFKFQDMMFNNVLVDTKFGKDMKSILAAVNIKNVILKAVENNASEFMLDDAEWQLLKDVVEEPTGGYNPAIVIHLTPFLLAVTQAE